MGVITSGNETFSVGSLESVYINDEIGTIDAIKSTFSSDKYYVELYYHENYFFDLYSYVESLSTSSDVTEYVCYIVD